MTAIASALAALTASGSDPETLASAIQGSAFLDATPGDARQQLRGERGGRRREERRGERRGLTGRGRARGACVLPSLSRRALSPRPPSFLSAARARLRKILADEEAKAAAEAARPAGERSPFVKEVREDGGKEEDRFFFFFFFGRGHPFARSPLVLARSHRCPPSPQSYDPADFEALAAAYEGLAWRAVSKPGGATVKPDEFYALYALSDGRARGGGGGGGGREEREERAGVDGKRRGPALPPQNLSLAHLSSPLSCSFFSASTSRPPSATSPANAPCGRSGAASTLMGGPGGMRGRAARAGGPSARGRNLSRPFGRRRPKPSTPTGGGRSSRSERGKRGKREDGR